MDDPMILYGQILFDTRASCYLAHRFGVGRYTEEVVPVT